MRALARAVGSLLCALDLHTWDYSGNAHTHAPAPIRCLRCRRRMP